MRLRIIPFSLLILLTPLFSGCQNNDPNYEKIIYSDGTEEIVKKTTIVSKLKDGGEFSILPDPWMEYRRTYTEYTDVHYYYQEGLEITTPEEIVLRWTDENSCSNYSILLADNKKMENAVRLECEFSTYFNFTDLFAGTHYYYQIEAHHEDRTVVSKRYSFKTVDFFRTINIAAVLNGRDLGNKKTKDGKKLVKQGLIYRTANFDGVGRKGQEQATNIYGIKTDLDLREQGLVDESPLGPEVQYINNGVGDSGSPYYVSETNGVNVPEYQQAMRDNLKVLAKPDNYPLAFHCAVGRDRTGTLAATLYLLLGVELDQIRQDYAVSFFSKACNTDPNAFDACIAGFENLMKYYSRYKVNVGSDDADIYERTETYCLNIGVSKDEISSIRNLLLEDIKK